MKRFLVFARAALEAGFGLLFLLGLLVGLVMPTQSGPATFTRAYFLGRIVGQVVMALLGGFLLYDAVRVARKLKHFPPQTEVPIA